MTKHFFPLPDRIRRRVPPVACQLRLTSYTSMPATDALVWQGVAEGRVDTQAGKNPEPAIKAAGAEIFGEFPNRKEK